MAKQYNGIKTAYIDSGEDLAEFLNLQKIRQNIK
jgi:hypothetical protein